MRVNISIGDKYIVLQRITQEKAQTKVKKYYRKKNVQERKQRRNKRLKK